MALYDRARLRKFLSQLAIADGTARFSERVVSILLDCWLDEYRRSNGNSDVIETRVGAFSYLFDVDRARLIAAWGISSGAIHTPRDKSRMQGHPLSDGSNYHRGHAIPHSLGGPTDINLVPQLGALNVGPFRRIEKAAVASPGGLYFTYWIYDSHTQRPTFVEQGLLLPNGFLDIERYAN
ncbi:MAG TPA: hypothetical protein VM076_04820 [Gemmatimonadaceae bacterium]|nr:hypothetical protein [Gemmatimonadaceae bacterium]